MSSNIQVPSSKLQVPKHSVMVFGVFDGLHDGHKAFLNFVSGKGEIVVVVARDLAVRRLKNKTPKNSQEERCKMIREFMPDATVILGDEDQGSYDVVKSQKPDMIVLGFDQHRLGEDLAEKFPEMQLVWSIKL